jgi:hypothetical protein
MAVSQEIRGSQEDAQNQRDIRRMIELGEKSLAFLSRPIFAPAARHRAIELLRIIGLDKFFRGRVSTCTRLLRWLGASSEIGSHRVASEKTRVSQNGSPRFFSNLLASDTKRHIFPTTICPASSRPDSGFEEPHAKSPDAVVCFLAARPFG